MNRPQTLVLAIALGCCSLAPCVRAQDAAAPIRRTSPSPSAPAPTPLGKTEGSDPTPEPTVKLQLPLPTGNGMALPTPEANQTPAPTKAPPAIRETPPDVKVEVTPLPIEPTPMAQETPEPATPPPVVHTPAPAVHTPPPIEHTPPPAKLTTPAPIKSTPVPTPVEHTPPPAKPTPAPSATPTPMEKKVEATPKPSPAPASTPKSKLRQEEPVRAIEPRPPESRRPWSYETSDAPGASRPTFDLSRRGDGKVAAIVRNLENRWQAAIRNHDVSALSALLASDFVGTSSTGRVGSKATLLSELRRDENTYTSLEARNMSVRTAGDDTAIVTGVTREVGTTKDEKRFKTSRRFTDTWVKRNGKWRCIASQTTELSR